MRTYGLYIGGRWEERRGRYEVRNPANQESIAECAVATEAEVDRAVQAAAEAFPNWSARSYEERGEYLHAIAHALKERFDELALLECQETGRPVKEIQAHDIPATISLFEYFAGIGPATTGETIPVPGEYLTYTRREPLGAVAAITPWNFPLWLAALKIAPALAAGNTVVLKPAPTTPLTTLEFAKITESVGLPSGVYNVLTDPTPATVGSALCAHPLVNKIAFTGSTATGTKIMQLAAPNITRLSLELGGKAPFILFADCDFERTLAQALLANFFAQGQMCTAGARLLIERSIYQRFLDAFVERASKLRIGDPSDPMTEFGTLHSQAQLDRAKHYVKLAQEQGARLVLGGKQPQKAEFQRGFFFEPTVFTDVQPTMTLACEEVFGPVVAAMAFEGEDEAVRIANATDYGLAAGVFTQDVGKALRMAHRVKAGRIWVNCYNMHPAGVPYGGFKKSGFGREVGLHCLLDLYTEIKSVQIDTSPDFFDWFM
ncbi:aldehyde dehydrogenase family protein [Candidatus Acetothermia bacterium]|jgi:acyl-CoA reductase-like NAD-dependent aldehyde dehydrogenase|nr:aldehyde dehydrogenase family protein [Candidatus Acetothermia bacterium]MCI2432684.1 aldehyde dehydrogenase family protein [Candidatus Acetothermia bacterium]MCI2436072.1 aldehyde dehydrogenase family protein [Candidatus Acetothermia bacterium]